MDHNTAQSIAEDCQAAHNLAKNCNEDLEIMGNSLIVSNAQDGQTDSATTICQENVKVLDNSQAGSNAQDGEIATNFNENLKNMENSLTTSGAQDGETAINFNENLKNMDNSLTTAGAQDGQTATATNFNENLKNMDNSLTTAGAQDSETATNFNENFKNMGNSSTTSDAQDGEIVSSATNCQENLKSMDNSQASANAQDVKTGFTTTNCNENVKNLNKSQTGSNAAKSRIGSTAAKGNLKSNNTNKQQNKKEFNKKPTKVGYTPNESRQQIGSFKPNGSIKPIGNSKAIESRKPNEISKPASRKNIPPSAAATASTTTLAAQSKIPTIKRLVSSMSNASNSPRVKGDIKIQTARSLRPTVSSITQKSASNITIDALRKPISRLSTVATKKQIPKTNLRKMTSTAGDHNAIDCLEKQLEDTQTEFLKQTETLKLAGKLKSEYKFISVIRNDECKPMIKNDDLFKFPQKLPTHSVSDFKEKIKICMDNFFASLWDNLNATNESPNVNVQTAKDKLEQLQILEENNILSYIDDLCSSQAGDSCDAQIVKMQKELQDCHKALKSSEKKLNDLIKHYEEKILNLENNLKSKATADLIRKDAELEDLQKKLKSQEKQNHNLKTKLQNMEKEDLKEKVNLQEELNHCKDCNAKLQKKLYATEQELSHQENELKVKIEKITKLEKDLVEMKNLKNNLAEMTIKLKELEAKSTTLNNCPEHIQQISELQSVVYSLEKDKLAMVMKAEKLEAEVNSLEKDKLAMEIKAEKLEAEVAATIEVRAKLEESENHVQDLQKQLEVSKKSIENSPDCSKQIQMVVAKFRQSEAEKLRENEALKVELSKSQFNMCQMEEQIQRDQQLLEVRCQLINSLQTNEKSQRIHIEELFAQVAEKNNTINELNNELRTKSEEFRNLFSTISAKQMELSNQEHIIKLLEESNERSQMLRVKQEEKIGSMEEELANLKHTIAIYEANVLSGNQTPSLLFAPMLTSSNADHTENFYYYTSQRKRKRQIDINVKKYEA